jgi:glycosyltransferase involved in cell wall biosynthesis
MNRNRLAKHSDIGPVRLLHIVGDSKFGGGSIVILRLALMAQQMGWHVDVLTTDKVFQKLLAENGVGIVDLDVIWRNIRPARDLAGLVRLFRFLRHSGYDIIHTHTSKAGFVGRLAARLAGIRHIVHTVHGFAFHEESTAATLRIYSLLERVAAHACDRIVTVSEFHRRWALKLNIASAEKIVAIPNGLPPDRVKPLLSRDEVRSNLGIASDTLLLLATGRLAEQKGFEYLLAALPEVSARLQTPFKLLFAGTGPLQEELTSLAANCGVLDRVQFLGFRQDIADLLAATDIVVLPTLREGLSIALLEAMAAGAPIITTLIGSNAEATQYGLGARLVPSKDSKALAAAIVELAAGKSLARATARRGKQIFERYYNEDRMLNGYRAMYRQLLLTGERPLKEVRAPQLVGVPAESFQ